MVRILGEIAIKDKGSSELLCFGYHVVAQKIKESNEFYKEMGNALLLPSSSLHTSGMKLY